MAESGASESAENDSFVPIPCEFCEKIFSLTEVIQHMSGCRLEKSRASNLEKWETDPQRSQVNNDQASEHRHAKSIHDNAVKIQHHVQHEVFDVAKMGDGYVLEKISTAEDGKITENPERGDGNMPKSSSTRDDKVDENAEKGDGDMPKNSSTTEDDKVDENAEKNNAYDYDEDDDDLSDLSDDNNPENETVEHFIQKALYKAEILRKATHQSEAEIYNLVA